MSEVSLELVPLDRKPVLGQLLELYIYDTSDQDGRDLDPATGRYGYRYLDAYWVDPDRYPFFVRVGRELAGFVLVNAYNPCDDRPVRSVAEFFVLRRYRGRGVGRAAARSAFDRFPGRWAVSQTRQNVAAQRFWDRVLADYPHREPEVRWVTRETSRGEETMRVLMFRNDVEGGVVEQHRQS